MEHARRNGTKSGKAVGRPKAVFDRDEVVRLRHEGLSWRQIASKLRVGGATARRAYKEWKASQAALNGDADPPDLRSTEDRASFHRVKLVALSGCADQELARVACPKARGRF